MAIFFVSIGMLLNVNFLMENFRVVVLISLLIILIKILGTSLGILISGGGIKTAFISGILLAPISEFSFVLILLGKKFGLVDDRIYQFFIASAVITMVLSPILFTYVHNLAAFVGNYIKVKDESWERLKRESELREHVIIIGFGLNGRSVARVLKGIGIPYVVIELNISTVKKMREVGELIFHGDATSPDVLRKAGIEEAKLMIITISDPVSSKRIVAIARSLNSNIYIIVRTRYVAEVEELRKLGANEVIPEEFEISVEIANRVLSYFKFPINLTKEYVSKLKEGSYELFRRDDVSFNELVQNLALPKNLSEHLRRVEFETYWVKSNSRAKQTSIGEMALRSRTGVTVLIVKRGEEIFINPSADFKFEVGDLVVLMGERNKIEKAIQLLDNGEA
ncbi:Trk K+ transport system, NAD-binding component [Candidatus Kryptonium thompsonii]|nr:Trk K+ transport system, NAD-binding component [Candidatus Kryptonium thompsoni]